MNWIRFYNGHLSAKLAFTSVVLGSLLCGGLAGFLAGIGYVLTTQVATDDTLMIVAMVVGGASGALVGLAWLQRMFAHFRNWLPNNPLGTARPGVSALSVVGRGTLYGVLAGLVSTGMLHLACLVVVGFSQINDLLWMGAIVGVAVGALMGASAAWLFLRAAKQSHQRLLDVQDFR